MSAVTKPEPAAEPAPVKPEPGDKPAPTAVAATPEKPNQVIPKSALELRAARRRVLQRRYGIWVGLPTLLTIIYYVLIAQPQYDSYLLLSVESSEGRMTDATGKAPNAGNQRDARLLRDAIRGSQGLGKVDKGGLFRKHYRTNGDWLTKLGNDTVGEGLLDYYKDKVNVTLEPNSNMITVRVRAFSSDAAAEFAGKLTEFATGWVEKQNETSSAARLKQAESEITRERENLAKAGEALAKIDNPKPTDAASIDRNVAEQRLQAALHGYSEAQVEVGRAQRYLVVLDGPTRSENPTLPRRLWGILTVCIGALVLVSVLSLLGASVREHAKF